MENNNKPEKKTFVNCNDNLMAFTKVIEFLQRFMPVTLAKRITAMALLAAGIPASHVTELAGLCDRSARSLLKSIQQDNIEGLFAIKSVSGQKSKTSGIESQIIAEIEKTTTIPASRSRIW